MSDVGPASNKSHTTSATGSRTRSWLDKADYRLHKLENKRPKKIEVPWFIGTGYFSEARDLVIDEWWDGSWASSNIDGSVWPDILGMWQVTFSWKGTGFETSDVDPLIVSSVDEFSDMRRDMPSSYAFSYRNQMSGVFWAGPDTGQDFVASVNPAADITSCEGRLVGQFVAPSPPMGST